MINEMNKVIEFHKKRRMFCIYQNKLFVAQPNIHYSHEEWFKLKGWSSTNSIPRGFVDKDIYFYVGSDFEINKEIETIFFRHIEELIHKLNLKPNTKIHGGLIKNKAGEKWKPKKELGNIYSLQISSTTSFSRIK
jgi:hypothetical protein